MDSNEMIVERPIAESQDGGNRVLVEKRVVKRRDPTAPLAFLLVAAFVVTYGLLMAGDRAGIRTSTTAPSVSTAEVPAAPAPTTPN